MNELTKFEQGLKLNLEPLLKTKGKGSAIKYIPWASAVAEFLKIYPKGIFKFHKNGESGFAFEEKLNPLTSTDEGRVIGYYVEVSVCDGEEIPTTHTLTLPIMDFKLKANMNFTVMEVNKAQFRCLTKVLALFGIGLPQYAGEEYQQYEIKDELDEFKDSILSLTKQIIETDKTDSTRRAKAIEIIGYKGKVDGIKKLEEAKEKEDKLAKFLEELKAPKKTKPTTKKTEKEEK